MLGSITQSHNTTARVYLPDVSADGLSALVRSMLGQEPADQHQRIRRGLDILMTGTVLATEEVGMYLVESQCEVGTYHRATTFTCSCKDDQRRGHGCKHVRALQLLTAASGAARLERWQNQFEQRKAARQAARQTSQQQGA